MPADTIHMLSSQEIENIFGQTLKEDEKWEKKEIKIPIPAQEFNLTVTYYYNKAKNTVLIASPLSTMLTTDSDSIEPDFASSVLAIKEALKKSQKIENVNLCGVLIGTGATEMHYVAFYEDTNKKMVIFDSKFSDPDRFLSTSNEPTLWQKVTGFFISMLNFIKISLGFGITLNTKFNGADVDIHRLGTQPIYDGISCGYHSSGAVLVIKNLINESQEAISQENIVKTVLTSKESMMNQANQNWPLSISAEDPDMKRNPFGPLGGSVAEETVNDMEDHVVSHSTTPPQSPLNDPPLEKNMENEDVRSAPK